MLRVAKFDKVSFNQFKEGMLDVKPHLTEEEIQKIYDAITLPKRATTGSAGYDFCAPYDITLAPGQTVKVPTGIRAKMEPGWALMLFPWTWI